MSVPCDLAAVQAMSMSKMFRNNTASLNSIDFSSDGEFVVSSADDEHIHLYSCSGGELRNKVPSKKYGVDLVRFTPKSKSHVICASNNGWDETLRYLSLSDNCYLRYFKGHRDRVVSLAVSPVADVFMSASLDKTVRLWDLRSTACQGLIHMDTVRATEVASLAPGSSVPAKTNGRVRYCLAFDPMGLVIAAAGADNTISLFDNRHYDKGPFFSIRVGWTSGIEFGNITFSPNGKYLLASAANTNAIFLMDAFTGQKLQEYNTHNNSTGRPLDASFSANGEFVVSGSDDKTIRVWDTIGGQEVAVWNGHKDVVRCVRWNPKLMMVASGCNQMAFWVPDRSPS